MSVSQDGEVGFETLDPELAGEPEGEYEDELLGEPSTEIPLGEYEAEFEDEDEQFMGGLLKGLGSALGLGESEYEDEYEDEYEEELVTGVPAGTAPLGEEEYEDEQFLPLLAAAAPLAAKALPLATKFLPSALSAIGGLFGRRRGRARRREGEYEYEDELEFELEYEDESPNAPMTRNEAIAQTMAAAAARTPSTHEAEALIGAATVMVITPREQATLQRLIPDIVPKLVQVNSILTRMARRRRGTQPIVTILPTAVTRATVRPLVRRIRRGQPVTRATVGRVVQTQTRRALTQPKVAARAARRNQRAVRTATQLPRARRGALTG